MLTRSSRLTGDLSVTWLPAGEESVIHSVHTPWLWQIVYSTTCMTKDRLRSMFQSHVETVQVLKIHMSVLLTPLVWEQAVVIPAAPVLFFTRVRVGGPQVRSIIKDAQQPTALRFAGSRMWFVLSSVCSSALLPQSFTLCPSHLGCPPYSVNYDLITTSLQIRSSSWPVIVWNPCSFDTSNTRGAHTSAVHACLSLFMCENSETSLFPSPEVGGSDGCYHGCLAPCFICQLLDGKTTANLHLCLYKYLSCCF